MDPTAPVADRFGPRIAPCADFSSFHEGTDLDLASVTAVDSLVWIEQHANVPFVAAI